MKQLVKRLLTDKQLRLCRHLSVFLSLPRVLKYARQYPGVVVLPISFDDFPIPRFPAYRYRLHLDLFVYRGKQ